MVLTFLWYKGVISGCETDVGDGDLVEFVRVPRSFVIVLNSNEAKYWSSETVIKLRDCL